MPLKLPSSASAQAQCPGKGGEHGNEHFEKKAPTELVCVFGLHCSKKLKLHIHFFNDDVNENDNHLPDGYTSRS